MSNSSRDEKWVSVRIPTWAWKIAELQLQALKQRGVASLEALLDDDMGTCPLCGGKTTRRGVRGEKDDRWTCACGFEMPAREQLTITRGTVVALGALAMAAQMRTGTLPSSEKAPRAARRGR